MGGGGRDRREEDRLAAERAAQQAATNTAITRAEQPSELEQFLNAEDLSILKYFSGSEGPVDVRNAPGMKTANALYDSALRDQGTERYGIGALRLGTDDNAGYTGLLRENQQEHRQQRAAGALEGAVNQRVATARGEAFPLINISENRDMGIAGLRSGMYESAADRDFRFRNRPRNSIWQSLIQGGAQAAQTKAMMGCVTLDTAILTPAGYVPIALLTEGDRVVAINRVGKRETLPIVRTREKAESYILKVTAHTGKHVECSPSDRLMTSADDRTETFAGERQEGDELHDGVTIKSIERLGERKPVKIIKLGNERENYGFLDRAGFLHLDDACQ